MPTEGESGVLLSAPIGAQSDGAKGHLHKNQGQCADAPDGCCFPVDISDEVSRIDPAQEESSDFAFVPRSGCFVGTFFQAPTIVNHV
jgi:hypothetical protein